MLRITICDDEPEFLRNVKNLTEDYCKEHGISEIDIEEFTTSFELSDKIEAGKCTDLYLLDIYMPGLTGIQIAQELRSMGSEAAIIFLTASKEHALEAFGVNAVQYLLKPISKGDFYAAMDGAIERVNHERRREIILKTDNGYQHIMIRSILYTEAHNKYQYIYLDNGSSLCVRMSSSALEEQLSVYSCFARCGSAYIIGLMHIESLTAKKVLMKNGVSIYIPRGGYEKLKNEFFTYFYER